MDIPSSLSLAKRPTKKPANRKDFISFAAVFAAIAVLYLHVNGAFWNMGVKNPAWPSANVIECVFYFAVPMFVMISGATLLNFFDRYGLGTYFQRRVERIVIPYIFWSLVLIGANILIGKYKASSVTATYIFSGLIKGGIGPNYYFFPLIFCVYLGIPLFAAVRKDIRKKVFIYLAIVGFLLNVAYPFMNSYFKWDMPQSVSITLINSYTFYIPIGYLIANEDFKWWVRLPIYALGLFGLFIHLHGSYVLSMEAGKIVSTYKGYLNMPAIMYSAAMFLAVRYAGTFLMKFKVFSKVIFFAKEATFSSYLFHQYILDKLVEVWMIDKTDIWFRIFFPWFLFTIIAIPVYFLKKLPGFKEVLPS